MTPSTTYQHVLQLFHLRRILEAAAPRGIEVIPLKGAHLITSVYRPDEPRSMCDVDLLVRPGDWDRALRLMPDLGFEPRHPIESVRWMHEVAFELELTPEAKLLVEVHRYVFEPRRFPLDHEALWRRSAPSTLDGAPCRRLSTEDHVAHVSLHAAIHRLMQLRRTLDDLERLFRRAEPNAELVIARAREWRATRAVWRLTELLSQRAPELHLEAISGALEPPLPARTALRRLIPDAEGHRFSHLHHRLQAALLWPLLLDSPALVLRFVSGHPWLVARRTSRDRG